MKGSDQSDYLRKVLSLDPVRDADTLVALRASALGLIEDTGPTRHMAPDRASLRQRTTERLRDLHDRFYELDDADLEAQLDEVVSIEEPDLSAWAARLRRASVARPALERLAGDTGLDSESRERVRELVIAPPQEAGRLGLAQLDRTRSKLGRQTARRIRRRHPAVFALAPDHFTRMAALRKERRLSRAGTAGGIAISLYVVFQLLRLIFHVVNR